MKKRTITATFTAGGEIDDEGFEPSGGVIMHPVKVLLTDESVFQLGKRLAENTRITIPAEQEKTRESCGTLDGKLMKTEQDHQFLLDILANTSGSLVGQNAETAKSLVQILTERRSIESQIKSLQLQGKVAVQRLQLDNEYIEHAINMGFEMNEVRAKWYVNWDKGIKKLIDLETGLKLEEELLTAAERQQGIDFDSEASDESSIEL